MPEARPIVLVSLADRGQAEELAAWLAEYEGMRTLLGDEVDAGRFGETGLDALVTDRAPPRDGVPTILLGDRHRIASENGIRAVLPLSAGGPLIAAAIRLALAGYRTVPAIDRAMSHPSQANGHSPLPIQLTQREREVIALLAEGASNKVIARRLDISVHTAKFHVAAILEKLGAVNRTDAIATAMREGLVLI